MSEKEQEQTKLAKVHCNQCRHATNHRILKSISNSGSDEEQGFFWRTEYEMLECCGCEEVVLRRDYMFSEDPASEVTFFPPPASRWLPSWRWSLPGTTGALLGEIYTALQANSLTLAMMGARAVIETAIIQKVGDHGTFKDNLQAMEDGGHVSKANRKYLAARV